jgi:type II secretory ATPase GspE/PulE/Tfp pilus assembly ATPase PilB-like protein
MPGLMQRILAAEVILPDRELCRLLAAQRDQEARRYSIIALQTPTMALHGFALVRRGLVGLEEFMSVASPGQLLEDLRAEAEQGRPRARRIESSDAAQ